MLSIPSYEMHRPLEPRKNRTNATFSFIGGTDDKVFESTVVVHNVVVAIMV